MRDLDIPAPIVPGRLALAVFLLGGIAAFCLQISAEYDWAQSSLERHGVSNLAQADSADSETDDLSDNPEQALTAVSFALPSQIRFRPARSRTFTCGTGALFAPCSRSPPSEA